MDNYNQIISENLKHIRTTRKLSLDKVCALTGISKSMLSQIEKGTANPSVSTIWKLANGFKISFTELMNTMEREIEFISGSDIQPLLECDGKYRNYPILLFDPNRRFETYRIEVDPSAELNAEAHLSQTQEVVTVMEGSLSVIVNKKEYHLQTGDTLKFKADVPHTYNNRGEEMCVLSMILYYPVQ